MISFVGLCRSLFLLAQTVGGDEFSSPRGLAWERRIGEFLAARGILTETLPGGCQFLGHTSLSGLLHQLDGIVACSDAVVIGEWKAYRGPIPKNELLRFKAVSDDYYLGMRHGLPRHPIMRIFGGTGELTESLQRYAAIHGITLIATGTWPAPVLAADAIYWTDAELQPRPADRRHLAWLSRPMQCVLKPQPNGSFVVPCPASDAQIDSILHLHNYWSDAMWERVDLEPGRFESEIARVEADRRMAA